MSYDWNFHWISRYSDVLLRGAWLTVLLNVQILLFGTAGGILLAWMGLSRFRVLRWAVAIYTELFRALPVLVTIIWMYYCLPLLLGDTWKLDAFGTAVAALSLNLAAIVGEVIRTGFGAIAPEPVEAARILGLCPGQIFRRIQLPLAWRKTLPSLVSQYVNTFKLSALASAIAVPELLHQASSLISITYRPLEFYTAVACLYLALILPLTLASRWVEHRFSTA